MSLNSLAENLPVKLLALCLAVILWFFVIWEQEHEQGYRVPVTCVNLPKGLTLSGQVPEAIHVRIAGPKILMMKLSPSALSVRLDFSDTGPGTVTFPGLERYLPLPRQLHVTRFYPSSIEVKLVREARDH